MAAKTGERVRQNRGKNVDLGRGAGGLVKVHIDGCISYYIVNFTLLSSLPLELIKKKR